MVIITESLAQEQLQQGLDQIIHFLQSKRVPQVQILYGVGCNTENLYEPIPVALIDLELFIQHSIEECKFELGEDDLFIQLAEVKIEFRLCHESDLHFESDDNELNDQVRRMWEALGFEVFENEQPIEATRAYRDRLKSSKDSQQNVK